MVLGDAVWASFGGMMRVLDKKVGLYWRSQPHFGGRYCLLEPGSPSRP